MFVCVFGCVWVREVLMCVGTKFEYAFEFVLEGGLWICVCLLENLRIFST